MTDPKIITLMSRLRELAGEYVVLSCHMDAIDGTYHGRQFWSIYDHETGHYSCTTHRELTKELERRVELQKGRKEESA